MNLNNINKNYALWKFFPILIFVFNPKIDIISIPNYWQGIRLDDLIILFYSSFFIYIFSWNMKATMTDDIGSIPYYRIFTKIIKLFAG